MNHNLRRRIPRAFAVGCAAAAVIALAVVPVRSSFAGQAPEVAVADVGIHRDFWIVRPDFLHHVPMFELDNTGPDAAGPGAGSGPVTLFIDFEWTANLSYDPQQDTGLPLDNRCVQTSATSCRKPITATIPADGQGRPITISLIGAVRRGDTAFVTAEIIHGTGYVDLGLNSDVETATYSP